MPYLGEEDVDSRCGLSVFLALQLGVAILRDAMNKSSV